MRITLDTNVLVYALDERDRIKQACARFVIGRAAEAGAQLALQVVGELQNVVLRRLHRSQSEAAAAGAAILATFDTFGYGRSDVAWALTELGEGRLGYWDALLLASAGASGQDVLLSEDLQDGCRYGPILVLNPFSADGLSDRVRAVLNP